MPVTIDTRVLNQRLRQFVSFVDGSAAPVIRDETRLLAQAAVKLTPPKRLSQGRAKVKSDIHKTMVPISEDAGPRGAPIRSAWLRRALASGNINEINEALRDGTRLKARAVTFDSRLHQKARSKRTGRVGRRTNPRYMATRSDASALAKYVRETQKRVGLFRAAWGFYVVMFGGRAPQWVKRNFDRSAKMRRDLIRLERSSKTPSITLTVSSHPNWAFRVRGAVRTRERSLARKIRLILRGKAGRVNTGGRFTIRGA